MTETCQRHKIAERFLGPIDAAGYCRCPGVSQHTQRNGQRDCRVRLNGAPTIFCVHSSCSAAVAEANYRLRSAIGLVERNCATHNSPDDTDERRFERIAFRNPKVPPFDPAKLSLLARSCPREITLDWLAKRSPVAVPSVEDQFRDGGVSSRLFLDTLYGEGERLLIFTRFYSQGDYLVVAGKASYRLGVRPGVKAKLWPLPPGADEGVWVLTAPVTGKWEPVSSSEPRPGRRHAACVTHFPFLLIESDTAAEALWLKALVQLPLSITALYTSGGKSVHALVKVDCETKAGFDAARDVARAVLCPLGADGAAMSAVRLSRLPGCLRYGKMEKDGFRRYSQPALQRLVYLNPSPPKATALLDLLK